MDISVEGDLKTVVNYTAKGKKTVKKYDAFVIEGFNEKYITVDIEELSDSPLVLKWDSFMSVSYTHLTLPTILLV